MTVVTRVYLAEQLMDSAGLSRQAANDTVNAILDGIKELALKGESVRVTGLGVFSMTEKAARQGRNPKNNVPAIIKARSKLSCRFSPKFKKMVSDGIV